jgi:hypothetical protein
MRGAQVLSGKDYLDWSATGCIPDSIIQSEPWVAPGMLLLCDCSSDDSAYFNRHLDETIRCYPAAILLFGSKAAECATEEVMSRLEAAFIPLIKMPSNLSPLFFSSRFAIMLNTNIASNMRTEDWLQCLCCTNDTSIGESDARAYGYNSNYQYCCAIFEARKVEKIAFRIEVKLRDAKNLLERSFSLSGVPMLSFISSDMSQLVCFVPVPHNQEQKSIRARIGSASENLRSVLNDCKWSVSVGTIAVSIYEFSKSYYDALQTQNVIKALRINEKVSFYDDWYMHMLILNRPQSELVHQMEHTLKPILDNPDLIDTLTNYLTFGENLKLTSEKMHVHVNTLRYRMQRIEELLECDLSNPNIRFRLRMVVTIYRYLNS